MPALDPIQGLWIGKTLGAMEQLSIRSFLSHGHPYHLYLYGPVDGLPEAVRVFDANEILPESEIFYYSRESGGGSPAGFSNVFRYKLLHEKGGWWCDLDVVCLKPFAFLESLVLCGQWRRSGWPRQAINPGIMKVPRNSPLMRSCLRKAVAAGKSVAWGQIGPKLLSKQFYLSWFPRELLGLRWAPRSIQAPEVFQPVDYWNVQDLVTPGKNLDVSRSYAVHLWNEMWRVQGLDKNAEFDADCLFEQLKSRYQAATSLNK
jgi:hypothetical protein